MPARIRNEPRHKKLTPEEVLKIRKDTRKPLKMIAYDYGVSISCIWAIKHRKAWNWVKEKKQ